MGRTVVERSFPAHILPCNTETDSGLKQCGLHSPGAESSPWNTWICPPEISKTYLRKSQEQDILSFQPKLLLPSACSPCVRASWCARQSALSGSMADPVLCTPPCCPARWQLWPLLQHRRMQSLSPTPHFTFMHISGCAQELHMQQHCWAREISASNSQKRIRRLFPALLVYR